MLMDCLIIEQITGFITHTSTFIVQLLNFYRLTIKMIVFKLCFWGITKLVVGKK